MMQFKKSLSSVEAPQFNYLTIFSWNKQRIFKELTCWVILEPGLQLHSKDSKSNVNQSGWSYVELVTAFFIQDHQLSMLLTHRSTTSNTARGKILRQAWKLILGHLKALFRIWTEQTDRVVLTFMFKEKKIIKKHQVPILRIWVTQVHLPTSRQV